MYQPSLFKTAFIAGLFLVAEVAFVFASFEAYSTKHWILGAIFTALWVVFMFFAMLVGSREAIESLWSDE